MAGHFGHWPNAQGKTLINPAADGPQHCSRPRFPSSRSSRRHGLGRSRCSGWMLIVLWLAATFSPTVSRVLLADRLMSLMSATETKDWVWFEDTLAYDNARLPQALIQTGLTTRTSRYVQVGLRSLRWLNSLQTTSSGYFRPVGTKSFGKRRQKPEAFDQQPVEASATISACLAAWRAEDGVEWPIEALRAFEWFLGENDLQTALIDPETGSCADGLHPDRSNENKGAESVLSYLLGLAEIRQLMRMTAMDQLRLASKFAGNGASRTIPPRTAPGSIFVPTPIHESPELVSPSGSGKGRRQTVQTGN